MQRRIKRIKQTIAALGPMGAIQYVALRRVLRPLRNALLAPTEYKLHSRYAAHPLLARSNGSDLQVFHQIFVALEYECLKNLRDVKLVIDCGANVGYSSAYFLTQFPACRVIAVEPDPENFAMLQKNLAPYGNRATLHRAGVWSHAAELVIDETQYRDGREWTRQVRERRADEAGQFSAVDVGTLLTESGADRLSLLKMDIEGAEVVVFSTPGHREWLGRVDAMAIELHDDTHFGKGTEVFFPAIASQGFAVTTSGELTICTRPAESEAVAS